MNMKNKMIDEKQDQDNYKMNELERIQKITDEYLRKREEEHVKKFYKDLEVDKLDDWRENQRHTDEMPVPQPPY